MSKLRYILLLTLCSVCVLSWAQKRYSASEQREYEISKTRGISTKDVENQTDVLWGLHASQYSGSHHLIGFSVEGSWTSLVQCWAEAVATSSKLSRRRLGSFCL